MPGTRQLYGQLSLSQYHKQLITFRFLPSVLHVLAQSYHILLTQNDIHQTYSPKYTGNKKTFLKTRCNNFITFAAKTSRIKLWML